MLPRKVALRPKTPLSADPNQAAFRLAAFKAPRGATTRALDSDYIVGKRLFDADGTLGSDPLFQTGTTAVSFLAWLGEMNVRTGHGSG
jgi:hypothetical protein